jgi:hypothetical protein
MDSITVLYLTCSLISTDLFNLCYKIYTIWLNISSRLAMQIDKCDRDEYSTNESIIYSMQD